LVCLTMSPGMISSTPNSSLANMVPF
jgi:hypothetical protein